MQQIPAELFVERRQALLGRLPAGSLALIPGAALKVRNRDVEYPFRQDSDFYYLTGFSEPDALLLLLPGRAEGETVLFCQPRDPEQEVWTGYRLGPERAPEALGVDQAFTLTERDQRLPELMAGCPELHFALGRDAAFDQQVLGWLRQVQAQARQGVAAPQVLRQIQPLLHEARLLKAPAEQAVMREAARISALGHRRAMQVCRPGMGEAQLEAELHHEFGRHGGRWTAYGTIVGGGANGCILHYTENQDPLREGELVLIDAGCELDHYAGDITRTFPVNGRLSPEQRALYEWVLKAQEAAIAAVRPGVSFNHPHEVAVRVLTEGLLSLGLLQGELEPLLADEAYKPYYMHRTSHWLGMDVHDVGPYREGDEWRLLVPGMALTIEPGLYIAPDAEGVEARWRGIGIRIEDDILVTEQGCEVLSTGVPKAVEEIETLMAEARG